MLDNIDSMTFRILYHRFYWWLQRIQDSTPFEIVDL